MFSKLIKPAFNKGLTLNVKRFFDLHEYQSKDVMRKFGVLVQKGDIATTPEQAEEVAKNLDVKEGILVLKAQVHAGGRGKGMILI
jgi:succinyl-CoA synthetase beta subunit